LYYGAHALPINGLGLLTKDRLLFFILYTQTIEQIDTTIHREEDYVNMKYF